MVRRFEIMKLALFLFIAISFSFGCFANDRNLNGVTKEFCKSKNGFEVNNIRECKSKQGFIIAAILSSKPLKYCCLKIKDKTTI